MLSRRRVKKGKPAKKRQAKKERIPNNIKEQVRFALDAIAQSPEGRRQVSLEQLESKGCYPKA